jgi:hypothetical protein
MAVDIGKVYQIVLRDGVVLRITTYAL